jgi:hypothetical protein
MLAAVLSQIEAGHTAQLDTKRLEEDCEQIGHQDDEQVAELCSGASC